MKRDFFRIFTAENESIIWSIGIHGLGLLSYFSILYRLGFMPFMRRKNLLKEGVSAK